MTAPVAWLCKFDGSVHRRGVHHPGDMPLIPITVLAEVADKIERELICCDVFERRDHSAKHHICYWGGAARQIVLNRAEAES